MIERNVRRGVIKILVAVPVGLTLFGLYHFRSTEVSAGPVHPQQAAQLQTAGKGGTADTGTPLCILGFSKNMCDGELTGGDWKTVSCDVSPPGPCSTLVGTNATLSVTLQNNPDTCGTISELPCDEAPDVVGQFNAALDFRIRLNENCPVRGCWEGTWEITGAIEPPIASGGIEGTLGVGTHRVPACPAPNACDTQCETCYAAVFDDSKEPAFWTFHVEGSMRGLVLEGEHAGCRVCVTMQGYFVAEAGTDGSPLPPDETIAGAWTFCGTIDGVLECDCPVP